MPAARRSSWTSTPGSFNIAPGAIEAAITPRTRAIVVVHLFGQMAVMEEILPIAKRHGLALIEDAAQAIGARRKIDGAWRMAGELGTVGTFSFFPSKNLGGFGDGGMMVTQDDALAERLRRLRLHGGSRQYFHDEVGYNSRLDTLQAAVLLAKLPHLADWSAARARNAARYTEAFAGHPAICPPPVDPANTHIYNQYTLRVPRRDELQAHLKASGYRQLDLLPARPAPAALLRASGLPARQPAGLGGSDRRSDLAPDLSRR